MMFTPKILRFLLVACIIALASTAVSAAGQRVRIETSLGTIELELYRDKAPITVDNFVQYARRGWYDKTIFHRVIDGTLIQTGGYRADLSEKDAGDAIENEAVNGLQNLRGTIAMARYDDPDSADSQFFINLRDNSAFDHRAKTRRSYGYCVFGKVTSGMDVADAIGAAASHSVEEFGDNVPVEPVVIQRLRLIRD